MLNRLYIFLIFCLFSTLFAQQKTDNFDLSYPESVPQNSTFDLSIITSKEFKNATKLKLFFVPGNKLEIRKIALKSLDKNINVQFSNSYIDEVRANGYKSVINLTDTSFAQGNFFQVLIRLKPRGMGDAEFKFLGEFTRNDSVLGYLFTANENLQPNGKNLITAKMKFYQPQESSDNALLFDSQSNFNLSLTNIKPQNLLTEFWFKPNGSNITFFKIKNLLTGYTELELKINPFQMLTASVTNAVQEFVSPYFLSMGSWYHIDIRFLSQDRSIILYCNDRKFSKIDLQDFSDPDQYSFEFENNSMDSQLNKTFQIDLLRFIELNNSMEVAFSNENYSDFLSDSSSVIYMFRFADAEELSNSVNYFNTEYRNVELVKSDAPIFARAPELNISILNNSYELSWSGGDYKQAQEYVLQKSMNGSSFNEVSNRLAENDPTRVYSIIDAKDDNADIVFYRVKQINKDGSVVYSSSVKVGQGLTEPFTLGQNFPNPFNPRTSIEVNLLEDADVTVTVYNLEGKEVQQLYKGTLAKGTHKFTFDATNLPSGIYIYKVATPDYSESQKMVLTK